MGTTTRFKRKIQPSIGCTVASKTRESIGVWALDKLRDGRCCFRTGNPRNTKTEVVVANVRPIDSQSKNDLSTKERCASVGNGLQVET